MAFAKDSRFLGKTEFILFHFIDQEEHLVAVFASKHHLSGVGAPWITGNHQFLAYHHAWHCRDVVFDTPERYAQF
ncbi:Uncharacterised protein [Enterobacter roggenkampii]|uniref:Uncharacterized protein n=1 Tax=Enterobacter roggenkampii TaxID=1812935 RepID=A0ABY0J9K5_9ENTR|nr:Uncharacterised protein [Enterobacter roggenkampii]